MCSNTLLISLAEFKECFSLYDKKQKGKIDAKDLMTVMRCLGTSPTIGETERHLQVHKIGRAQLFFSFIHNCVIQRKKLRRGGFVFNSICL